jgi:hypothetical protein
MQHLFPYLEQLKKRLGELSEHMVNLGIQGIRLEKRSPALEYGMCDSQNSRVDFGIIGSEPPNKVLHTKLLACWEYAGMGIATHINQSVPSLPKVTVSNNAYCFTELILNSGRDRSHETNYLLFDCNDLVFGE